MLPTNPPPHIPPRYVRTPRHIRMLNIINEETLRPFIGHYIFCWMRNRRRYWFFPLSVSPFYLRGYVWRWGAWRPAQLKIRMIDSIY